MNWIKAKLIRTCPKTGRIVGLQPFNPLSPVLFPLIGFAALIWVLIRVGPKPSRASYPCQQIAMPLAQFFLTWLLGPFTAVLTFKRLQHWFAQGQLLKLASTLALGAVLITGASAHSESIYQVGYLSHTPNTPIGSAQGSAPGRVVWVHDPDVTDWAGPSSAELWYEHIDQDVASDMMTWALRSYAEADTLPAAWEVIFNQYNDGRGYLPGEKILIKINLTTVNAGGGFADASYNPVFKGDVKSYSTANSPQLMAALLDQLVNSVGVSQSDITIGDSTGLFVNYLYDPLHAAFPDVHYEDQRGTLGRSKAAYTSPCMPYTWSTADATGTTTDCVIQSYAEADYLINFAVLKSHERAGITVAAKNHYGSMLRLPTTSGYYNVHQRLPLEDYNTLYRNMGHYRPLVDLMGNENIGGKTLLYIVDGIYGGKGWASIPSLWSMPPFNEDWPSSIFVSMDPVAIDSVAFDFLSQQWPEQALKYEGVQDYLHEAALAEDPGSETCYDPEGDSTCMTSLGVHEHWNSPQEKQYSRNLGTGDGIELLYVDSEPGATSYTLTVAADPEAGGATTPVAGSHPYEVGTEVPISAVPNPGYAFDHWSGDCSGTGNCTVIMDADRSVTAHFSTASILGDVNRDGAVGATDALIILSGNVGLDITAFCPINCGDVDGNGGVNATDALMILSYDVGFSIPYPGVGGPGCPATITQPTGCTP